MEIRFKIEKTTDGRDLKKAEAPKVEVGLTPPSHGNLLEEREMLMQIPAIPFTILALAPFGPVSEAGAKPGLVNVDLDSLDDAVRTLSLRLYLPASLEICPQGGLTLEIKSLKDFKPDVLIKNNDYLRRVSEAGRFVGDAQAEGRPEAELVERLRSDWADLPLDLEAAQVIKKPKKSNKVDDILAMVALDDDAEPAGPKATKSTGLKEQVDQLLAALLDVVFSNPEFRTYEAAWRGLETLLKKGPVKESQGIGISICPVSADNLASVLTDLAARLAVAPPNLVLIDLPFDSSSRSTDLLEEAAVFAGELLAPTVCWIGSAFFHLPDWTGLRKVPYLKHHLEDATYAKWRKLAEHPGAYWLGATCNRFPARVPYGRDNPPRSVFFRESEPLWLGPVWAIGALAVQSYLKFGWPSRITDYTNLSLKDLPLLESNEQGPLTTEMFLSEDRLMEFIEAGIMPLYGPVRKDEAFLPKETTLAGGSLKYQLFMARVLGFLFWCKANMDGPIREGDPAANLKTAFTAFWERSGHPAPDDLAITAEATREDGTTPLSISMTPPQSILPGGRPLEFTFTW